MLYEIVKLRGPLLRVKDIDSSARQWISEAPCGKLLGSWRTEVGTLGEVILLRSYDSSADLQAERSRTLHSENPFYCKDHVMELEMESYKGFDWLPAVSPRALGSIYEFRTYFLKPGGLSATMQGWREAVPAAKEYTEHLVTTMFALDGPPRITHIWGFESFDERLQLRAKHYGNGTWPPRGGPDNIRVAKTQIAIPNDASPLH